MLALSETNSRSITQSSGSYKGAQAVAASIFIALHWTGEIDELKVYIRDFVTNQFEYNMNRTLNEIRPDMNLMYLAKVACPRLSSHF